MTNLSFLMIGVVFWPFAAAIAGYILGRIDKKIRDLFVWIALGAESLGAIVLFIAAFRGNVLTPVLPGVCGFGLDFKLSGFRALFVLVSAFLWMMSSLLSPEYLHHERNRNRYYLFLLLTQGATMGVFLSADLYTTFVFFEIMSFTSYVWVAQNETKEALDAARTYLGIAVIGGLILLMGLFLLYHILGTLRMDELYQAVQSADPAQKGEIFCAGILVLLGFGAKAAMFPLHVWMPRAHTVAPAPASALLSGILTKAGLFGILVISGNLFFANAAWGNLVLILGLITMTLGAVLAVFAVNLKRTLACSSMSQMGFVLTGIGMSSLLGAEGALAARGAVLHMVNHSLFKLILFLCAGVVFMNLEELELNDVRGFGRKKPLLKAVFLSGALGIGGIPLFSGYISKTLLHESILEYMAEAGSAAGWYKAAELLFLFCGGLTVAYMIKLYIALFVNQHPTRQAEFDSMKNYAGPAATTALVLSAVVIPVMGIFPGIVMDRAADMSAEFFLAEPLEHVIHYFSLENLKGAAVSIIIGVLVYFFFIRKVIMVNETAVGSGNRAASPMCARYRDLWPEKLDLERSIYIPLITKILPGIFGRICLFIDRLPDFLFMLIKETWLTPIHLLSIDEEEAKILRHRRRRLRLSRRTSATVSQSYGLLASAIGILCLFVWVLIHHL